MVLEDMSITTDMTMDGKGGGCSHLKPMHFLILQKVNPCIQDPRSTADVVALHLLISSADCVQGFCRILAERARYFNIVLEDVSLTTNMICVFVWGGEGGRGGGRGLIAEVCVGQYMHRCTSWKG
jgi:hypothetical protein